ncbi:MAG: tail fiber domain-containing protein, partial [Bacteroidota bacterium]
REDYAIAIGWNSDARGQASIALGPSDAYGYNSFSTGWVTEARGNYSSTFGYQTNSYPYASMALGRFNVVNGDSASWIPSDPIFIIGDGTSNNNRSNSFVVQKNGQTAIGYNAPTGMLQVSTALGSLNNGGALDPDNASILIGQATSGMAFDANQIESIGSALNLNFNSAQEIHMAIGGGEVAIGHNAPLAKLDVHSTGWQFRLDNDNAGGEDWFVGASDNGWNVGGGKFIISRSANSTDDVFVIENFDQQVGIGVAAPSDRLHINAAAGEDALRVQTNGTTRFRVHANGGVSIGGNVGPPVAGLYVEGNSEFDGNVIPDNDAAFTLGSGTNRWVAVFAVNGTVQTSDIRLKTQIQPLAYGLAELLALQPIHYRWSHDPSAKAKIGFSAQELYEVVPEVVNGTPDGDVDTDPMGVNYAEMVPVLVKAIQEQQAQIDALKAEVEALKNDQK